MDSVELFLQTQSSPRLKSGKSSSTSTMSPSSLFLRSCVRPSGPDDTPRQKPARTVSWDTHVEVWQQASRSVTWSTQVEVFVIPAQREASPHAPPRYERARKETIAGRLQSAVRHLREGPRDG